MSSYEPYSADAQRQMQQLQDWWKQKKPQVLGLGAVVLTLLVGTTSYYQVEPDELGVVMRFGAHISNTEPGLHFKLPLGIDQVIKVPVERQLKMEFGFRTKRAGIQSEFLRGRQELAEAKMVTGDRNVAVVEWIVQYKIASPEKFLFNFRDVDTTIRLMAEATMRSVVGDYTIDELITGGREHIERESRERLEALNERYQTGIVIQQLKLQDANVPDSVKPALREVEEAKQEKANAINLAQAARNKVIPEAGGRAREAIATAEGYRIARINRAKGDAERFRALYAEYRKAPEVTRTRLYLEAMSEVVPKAKEVILVDTEAKSVLPLLNLGGEKR